MFTRITLKNFRTHRDTTIQLKPITLLIGNNNSGKTNLLTGIQHFCNLVRKARPDVENFNPVVSARDYLPHKYRLASDEEPMGFLVVWDNTEPQKLGRDKAVVRPGEVTYEMELYRNPRFAGNVGCREKITTRVNDESRTYASGYDDPTNMLVLRKTFESAPSLGADEKRLCSLFFRRFASAYSFHFQPTFLKGFVDSGRLLDRSNQDERAEETRPVRVSRVPADLGYQGGNFLRLLLQVKESDERVFSRFIALLRRFESSFQGVRSDDKHERIIWEFDLGRQSADRRRILDEFPSEVVSDGFMKAAVLSLLTSLWPAPSLIMLEEIENGINPGNLQELMSWIWQAAARNTEGDAPQFLLTSHSPTVLREFNDHLDHVYTVHLHKKSFQSDVRNLNDSLDTLIGIGTVEGERDEKTKLVKIPKYQLAELWYSGTIG